MSLFLFVFTPTFFGLCFDFSRFSVCCCCDWAGEALGATGSCLSSFLASSIICSTSGVGGWPGLSTDQRLRAAGSSSTLRDDLLDCLDLLCVLALSTRMTLGEDLLTDLLPPFCLARDGSDRIGPNVGSCDCDSDVTVVNLSLRR